MEKRVRLSSHISAHQLGWRNDPRIYAYTRQNGILTEFQHRRWLDSLSGNENVFMFGVEMLDGTEIGTVGLTGINWEHRTAEFSIFIAPRYQGIGLGGDALEELLEYGFHGICMETIWGEVFEGNKALEVFKKHGMVVDGILRGRYEKNGKRINATAISITRKEWEDLRCQKSSISSEVAYPQGLGPL